MTATSYAAADPLRIALQQTTDQLSDLFLALQCGGQINLVRVGEVIRQANSVLGATELQALAVPNSYAEAYAAWLACRAIDGVGQGWIELNQFPAPADVLVTGNGILWHYTVETGRIYLIGLRKVAGWARRAMEGGA